jgi:hypothetical protein
MSPKRKTLLALGLALCAAVAAAALAYQAKSDEQQQVEIITSFYENYLARPWRGRSNNLPIGFFYSKGADALITKNAILCEKLSRGDEICGYGADADIFLNAQEIDPDLTFVKARFRVVAAGKNTVEVSFNVYPELGEFYERKIRYVLVKETAGWRVDDVFFEDDGRFPANRSMRYEINEENEAVSARARDISEVARWVSTYLGRADMLARAERFVSNPVQVCSAAGRCESVTKGEGDVKLRHTMEALHRAYHVDDSDSMIELGEFLPRSEPLDGETVQVDALDFSFRDQAWWITKIDLGRLGRTVPVRRQRDGTQ